MANFKEKSNLIWAVAELLPNLIQAGGGIVGGRMTYAAFARVSGDSHPAKA